MTSSCSLQGNTERTKGSENMAKIDISLRDGEKGMDLFIESWDLDTDDIDERLMNLMEKFGFKKAK